MSGRRGFTLIEVMICIAILAIVFSVPWSLHRGHAHLLRQANYRFALRNAETQLEALRAESFDQLPPAVVTVGQGGAVQLPHGWLEQDSLKVRSLAGEELAAPLEVESQTGRLKLEPKLAGQKVIIDYAFYVADQGEAHRVSDGKVALENGPVVSVDRVWLARGEQLTPVA
ncbi:MAG: prepilin-type N-terminal cleavage/methylation domain-containing protein, partial [Candidatus Eremiobacteraeota bacterium]|nr:prepilin-type N-terminal cleavage/methylation domain-containing protein [Candidatus Eremiobacteraeota bacterium]